MALFPDLAFESTRRLTREEFAEWIADRPPDSSTRGSGRSPCFFPPDPPAA